MVFLSWLKDAEVLSGVVLTVHANLSYFTCGFMWQTSQWCEIPKGGSQLGLSEEFACCAGNLHSGNIHCKIFCPEHIGK